MAQPTGLEPLSQVDPELSDLIEKEKTRQWHSLELIASENFTSKGTSAGVLVLSPQARQCIVHCSRLFLPSPLRPKLFFRIMF